MELKKKNQRPLTIFFTRPKTKEPRAFFQYNGTNYYLDSVIRAKDNPWTGNVSLPDYIHGYIIDNWGFSNLYVEILPDNEHVNVYMEKPFPDRD